MSVDESDIPHEAQDTALGKRKEQRVGGINAQRRRKKFIAIRTD